MKSTGALGTNALSEFLSDHPGRDFDRGGLRLHYLDEGDGEPVVMVHGNPTWSFYFRRLVESLSPSHRVVVPDHIGCGLSDKPDDSRYGYTLASRVDDLEALLDSLDVKRNITLVVHDWGGMIGFAFAVRHPGRIARLVVMNTAAFHMPAAKSLPWSLWLCRDTPVGTLMVRGFNAFARGTAWIGCTKRRMSHEVREAYVAPYDSWTNRIANIRFVQDIPLKPGDRSYELVSQVEQGLDSLATKPILIAWGMKDFVFDEPFLDEWILHFPDATVLRFEEAGHYVLEDEQDRLVEAIRRFASTGCVPADLPRGSGRG